MLLLPEGLRQKLYTYFEQRPWTQAELFIHALQQLEKIDTNPDHNPTVSPEVAEEVNKANAKADKK